MSKPHAIFLAADSHCGDFLARHLLVSLRENVDLDQIDVWVLDFGLSQRQKRELPGFCFRKECLRDGFIGTIRFREISRLLGKTNYRQAMVCDAGDIIFQADISHLFRQHQQTFRCVCEERDSSIHHLVMPRGDFTADQFEQLTAGLEGKPTANCGFVLGPAKKFIELWHDLLGCASGFQYYCTDQLVFNHVVYRDGFERLDNQYNFVVVTARSKFVICDGQFLNAEGEVIPVVHNAGGKRSYRVIRNFGYGKNSNQRKRFTELGLRVGFVLMKSYRAARHYLGRGTTKGIPSPQNRAAEPGHRRAA